MCYLISQGMARADDDRDDEPHSRLVTPSEFKATLARVNERLRSVVTAASSLLTLALVTLLCAYGLNLIAPSLAKTIATIALVGGAGLALAWRILAWQRDEIYDDIVLAGLRHVHPQEIARRTAELLSRPRRRQLADTLDRFVETAVEHQQSAVPLHRDALILLQPQVEELSAILREDERAIDPAGIVLLRRLVTDGARSPLFHPDAEPRDLARELERIRSGLGDESRLAA
jgi:hypothetical protein